MTTLPPRPLRLLLVDDSALVRQGITAVLASHSGAVPIEVVGEASSVAEALKEGRRLAPDVVLLDIRLPDGSGFEVCRTLQRERSTTRVIVLTSFSNDEFVCEAVTSGAHGYLMKEIDPAGLVAAIADVASGKTVLASDVTDRVLRLLRGGAPQAAVGDLALLSGQERRVLALVAEGLTNKQVGERLTLSENTVKNYLVSVFEKLRVKRRSQAAALYAQVVPKQN